MAQTRKRTMKRSQRPNQAVQSNLYYFAELHGCQESLMTNAKTSRESSPWHLIVIVTKISGGLKSRVG
jgi:hypothetical protein